MEIYFSKEHEWIKVNGSTGIVGISELLRDGSHDAQTRLQAARTLDPELPVVLKGDAAAPYERVLDVLQTVKKLDIAEVGFVTKRAP